MTTLILTTKQIHFIIKYLKHLNIMEHTESFGSFTTVRNNTCTTLIHGLIFKELYL